MEERDGERRILPFSRRFWDAGKSSNQDNSMLHLQHEFVQPLSVVHAKPSFAFCMHWNHELASSGGTARQRLGLRKSSAAFPCMHRMGKRQGTGKSESQLDT